MLENLRVHLIGVGTKSDWIIKSFENSRPDKVYLFKKRDEKNNDALSCEAEIEKYLKKKQNKKRNY